MTDDDERIFLASTLLLWALEFRVNQREQQCLGKEESHWVEIRIVLPLERLITYVVWLWRSLSFWSRILSLRVSVETMQKVPEMDSGHVSFDLYSLDDRYNDIPWEMIVHVFAA